MKYSFWILLLIFSFKAGAQELYTNTGDVVHVVRSETKLAMAARRR